MDPEAEDEKLKKRLLSLKKELKCWESMFERKHGHKPAKTDIDESPLEIRETYHQYQKLKGNSRRKERAVKRDPSHENDEVGEVFGAFLNKKKPDLPPDSAEKGKEKQATWKLRKWTKGQGYKTVVVGDERPEQASKEKIEMAMDSSNRELSKTEKQAADLEVELESLSQGITIKSRDATSIPEASDEPIVLAGQYCGSSFSPVKLRHGHKVSSKWLERCKPDLSGLLLAGEGEASSSWENQQVSEFAGSSSDIEHSPDSDMEQNSESGMEQSLDSDLLSGGVGVYERMFGSGLLVEDEENNRIEPHQTESSREEEGTSKPYQDVPQIATTSSATLAVSGGEAHIADIDGLSLLEQPSASHAAHTADIDVCSLSLLEQPSASQCSYQSSAETTANSLQPDLLKCDFQSASTEPEASGSVVTAKVKQARAKFRKGKSLVASDGGRNEAKRKKWQLQGEAKGVMNTPENPQQVGVKSSMATGTRSSKTAGVAVLNTPAPVRALNAKTASTVEPTTSSKVEKPSADIEDAESGAEGEDSDEEKCVGWQANGKSSNTSRTSSAVSENFVRLNMKVKRYSKKPGRITGAQYKRKMWRKYQKGRATSSGSSGVCFKCGMPGHWARNCPGKVGSKNLGKFAGEKVQFSDSVALLEDEMDDATLEQLTKDSPFPTIEEAALMARGIKPQSSGSSTDAKEMIDNDGSSCHLSGEKTGFVPPPPCHLKPSPPPPSMEPLITTDDGRITAPPPSVYSTLRKFGYQSFRPGQEEAITRILSGISVLLVLSTGSGKSLCYQLPAYLYAQRSPCLTLVISPLIALMEDQVQHFPLGLKGACLHTNQTKSQQERVLGDVVEGRVDVLLLSPEALVGGAFWNRRRTFSLSRLPPVAFACIDEAHCVSEWSHNFRPSYLRIYKVLRERLGVHCILGLTATATKSTALSVAQHLGIVEENIICGSTLPDNLHISVSCDQDRDQALVELLQSPNFRRCGSIIIYCTRQQQTESVSQLLRTCLQSLSSYAEENSESEESDTERNVKGSRKRKGGKCSGKAAKKSKLNWSADCYHAGMNAAQRKRVQVNFMAGKLRIVVATVAFGMGLNKADVRAIIHYNMPKSFESFVQEIGRAGRDGLPAYCHVFIDKEGSDLCELRRHAYSSTVDPYTIKQFIKKAFPKCQCKGMKQAENHSGIASNHSDDATGSNSAHLVVSPPTDVRETHHTGPRAPLPLSDPNRWCAGHEVAIPIESTVQGLDVKEECISTLLCYLELQGCLEVMNSINDTCTLKCYGGPRQLRALAQKVPAVAAAAARLREEGIDLAHTNTMKFSVVGVSNSMGWQSSVVRSEVHSLQYNDRQTTSGSGAGSTVLVEFSNLSFHLRSPGDLAPDELDFMCDFLYKRVKRQEKMEVERLYLLHGVLMSVACRDYHECCEDNTQSKQAKLRSLIHQYFDTGGLESTTQPMLGISILPTVTDIGAQLTNQICQDIHSLVSIHYDQRFTGRAIARIFHGIASPCFPAEVWGRQQRFWRRYLDVDFDVLSQIARRELIKY